MGRTICLWLLGCLALASAIPLPGPASEQDILNMILNAKPEDNDIDPIPTVTETTEDGLKEQELPQPEDLQEIPEDSKTQAVPEEEKDKPEPENLDNTSELLPVDQFNSDQTEDAGAETPEESVPVTDVDQIPTELDAPEEDQLLTEEVAEAEPQTDEEETPVILVADDQIVPLDPQEAPIIILQETQNEEGMLPVEELPFSQDEEEQEFPVNEGEELPIDVDEEQFIVISEDNTDFNLDPNDDDQELVPVAVVELEEDELSQPILSEPLIPGLSNEETQVNADVPPFDISPTNGESEIPVYFDFVNIPEPVQGNDETISQLFTDPIFRSSPPVYPSEDNYQPTDEELGVFYIPESRFPIEDRRYEYPEMRPNFFVNQAEALPEDEVMSDDEFSTETSVQFSGDEVPSEESLNTEDVDPEADITNNQGEDLINTEQGLISEYPLTEEEPNNFEQNQMPLLPAGEPEFEKVGTVIVLEAPDSPVDSLEPTLEIIRLDDAPVDQESFPMEGPMISDDIPESLMTPDYQPMIGNDQIVPVAEFPEEGILPVNYWIADNEDQQPIIFPEEFAPRHDLPVFPQNWNDEDISLSPTQENLYPNIPSQYSEAPSYDTFSNEPSFHGPSPPQENTEEHTRAVFNLANDEMPTRDVDFMTSPDFPQSPREEVITVYDNDNENMFGQSGHIHIPNGFPQTSEYSNFRTRFNRPAIFGVPSMFDIAFQQDYHGPNTFPLNFRRPDFSSQMTGTYYNPYNDRFASYSNVNENMFSDSSVTPQDFSQGSNLGNIPKAFPSTQNMFFSMLNEPVKMIQDNDEQNMNLRTFQNSPTLMGSDRFNQQDQQYDVQLSIVPFENSYNVPSYTQSRQQEIAYPYAQQSNNYDTYQGFSYNSPAYGGSNIFTQVPQFSSPSIPSRYDMSFNYGSQNSNDRRFNYPVPTW